MHGKKRLNMLVCQCCKKSFIGSTARVCSEICRREIARKNKKIDGIEGYDYLICDICGTHAKELALHYKRYHTEAKLQKPSKCKKLRDSVRGENNPAYQHGGLFSPFSKNFVNYDGEESRKLILKKQGETRKKNGTNPFTREFYNTDEDYSKAQTRDLTWFIEKFGEIEGKHRYIQKTEKWMNSLDVKTDDEKKRINRLKIGRCGAISNAEKEILQHLLSVGIIADSQFQLKKLGKGYYLYDITVGNKIIEYNGDFWHCNPLFWDKDEFNPRLHITASNKWKLDKLKNEFAKENGYEVMIVWEQDYKHDKQGIIEKCINFLKQ